jgi:TolB-like protein/DNA-binding winged helix-turn-helix (wHTH) protein/Tfp pilus assembly protein PilF
MSEMGRIRIGPWTANPALNLIERGTRSVKIEPRAMDVLVFLARHNEAVVSVDELIAAVWKGVVVGDGSVYLAINQLRQALDDPADGTRCIETIPKRGYRLTVPVEYVEPVSAPAPSVPQASLRQLIGRRFRWWPVAALVGVVIVIFAAFALILRNGARPVPPPSVTVLPFDNLSSDTEQEYFADGITVEILNTLARVRGLRVTGRVSSFHFKGRNEDLRSIGEALGVEHILEGSVRKAANQVRITVQLSSARTGEHLWSETYERKLDDIFLIQDEIAKAVASALQVKLGVGDLGSVPGMTRNVAAYDDYLRGMSLNLDWRPESFPLAIARLQRAVELDPSFSVAWAGLNTAYTNGAMLAPDRAPEWLAKASEALERARALTPDAPHVLLEVGIGEARRGKWSEAAVVFEQLQTSYARYGMASQAWGPRGVFLLGVGRAREAVSALERAREEEPLAPAYAEFLSQAESAGGNLAGALAEVDRGLKLEGLATVLQGTGFVIALTRGDRAEIQRRLDAMSDSQPGFQINRRLARFMDAPAGAAAEIRRIASAASQAEKGVLAHWAAYYNEPELSLELLAEVAPDMGHPGALWQPLFREVRKLPAFKELVRDLGFVDYWRTYGWSDFCHPSSGGDFACG